MCACACVAQTMHVSNVLWNLDKWFFSVRIEYSEATVFNEYEGVPNTTHICTNAHSHTRTLANTLMHEHLAQQIWAPHQQRVAYHIICVPTPFLVAHCTDTSHHISVCVFGWTMSRRHRALTRTLPHIFRSLLGYAQPKISFVFYAKLSNSISIWVKKGRVSASLSEVHAYACIHFQFHLHMHMIFWRLSHDRLENMNIINIWWGKFTYEILVFGDNTAEDCCGR